MTLNDKEEVRKRRRSRLNKSRQEGRISASASLIPDKAGGTGLTRSPRPSTVGERLAGDSGSISRIARHRKFRKRNRRGIGEWKAKTSLALAQGINLI